MELLTPEQQKACQKAVNAFYADFPNTPAADFLFAAGIARGRAECAALQSLHDAGSKPYDMEIDRLMASNRGLRTKLDALMLEYCPDEMPPEQVAEWAEHQRAAPPYPQFCRHPTECAGRTSCPRQPACSE